MSDHVRLCMIGAGGHSSRNIYPCFYLLKGDQPVTTHKPIFTVGSA